MVNICDLKIRNDALNLNDLLGDIESHNITFKNLKAKLANIEAKHIAAFPKIELPIIDMPDILPIKIGDKELKDLDILHRSSSKVINLFLDSKGTTGASLINHYDNTIVDEINVLNSFSDKGPLLVSRYTNQMVRVKKFLLKQGLSKEVAEKMEHDINSLVYSSTKSVPGEGGWLESKFNFGYRQSELAGVAEADLDLFEKNNKGYVNFLLDKIKQNNRAVELEGFDYDKFEVMMEEFSTGVVKESLELMDKARKMIGSKDPDHFKFKGEGGHATFFKDLTNSFMGDPQFVFKYKVYKKGTSPQGSIEGHFIREWIKGQGRNPSLNEIEIIRSDARKVYNTFIDRKIGGLRKFFKEWQAAVYLFKYDKLSMGYGHLSMGVQLASNIMEMTGILRYMSDADLLKVQQLEKKIGSIGEDTFAYGTGLARERLDETYIARGAQIATEKVKSGIKKLSKKLGVKNEYLREKIANNFEIYTMSPMLLDGLNDKARTVAAYYKILNKFGDDIFTLEPNTLRSIIREEYGRLGGAVISTSPIYRETRFTMLDPDHVMYTPIAGVMDSFRFLKGWAISKTLTIGDTAVNGFKAMQSGVGLSSRDKKLTEMYAKEFAGFTLHLAQATMNSLVLYARFEKYNHDTDEKKLDTKSFMVGMTNQLVAMDIFIGEEISNILGFGFNEDLTYLEQGNKLSYELMAKTTNYMKTAGFATVVADYLENNPGEWIDAVSAARSKILGGMFRYGKLLDDESLSEGVYSQDPLSMLGVEPLTKEQIALGESYEVTDNLHYIEGKKENLVIGLMSLFKGYGFPSDYYVKDKSAQLRIDQIIEDEGFRQLMDGSAEDFDLEAVYNYDPLIIEELYKNVQYKGQGYAGVNKDISKTLTPTDRREGTSYSFDLMDKFMSDLYVEEGMTYEDIHKTSMDNDITDGLAKVLHIAQKEDPQKVKYILPYLIEKDFREYKDDTGRNNLNEEELIRLKARAIQGRLELFDVNVEGRQQLMRAYMDTKPELYEGLEKKVGKDLSYVVNGHLDNLMLQTRNLEDSGTNVKYLTSKYRTNLSFMNPNSDRGRELYADYVIKSMVAAEQAPIPEKDRIARQASFLLGMTKKGSDILSDNKKFQALSTPAKKQLSNWYFKTHNEMDRYSAETVGDILKYKNGGGGKKSYRPSFNKSKSSYGSGQRPGFSSQMPQRIPKHMLPYIDADPSNAIRASIKHNKPFNRQLLFRLPRAITKLNMNVQFHSILSSKIFREIEFKGGAPIKGYVKTNRKKIKYSARTKKKYLKKSRPGKVSLDKNLPNAVELIK